jgi:hypothetical protein
VEDEGKLQDTLESLPMTAQGIAESTANGKGNWFERTFTKNWQLLQNGDKPAWYPMFFAWFDDPNNATPWIEGTRFKYPVEVAEMRAKYRNTDGTELTDHQVLWWDSKKHELEDRMNELYPSNPEEAFIFSTGRVYPNFSRSLHVIDTVSYDDYEIAADYGQQNPMCFLFIHRDADDNYIVFREFYRKDCPIADAAAWLFENAKEKIDNDGYLHIRFADPSIFGKTQVRTTMRPGTSLADSHGNIERSSIAEEFRKHKVIFHRGTQNAVLPGISRVKEYMKFDMSHPHPFQRDEYGDVRQGAPRLFVSENCTSLIWEFANYLWPKDPVGNINKESYENPRKLNDHACLTDSVRCEVNNKGTISIKQVKIGDYIRSASGWTKVLESGQTGIIKTRKITLSNGMSIEGTDGHPIFVIGKGLVPMKDIKYNDQVCTSPESQDAMAVESVKNCGSMDCHTIDIQTHQTQSQVGQGETTLSTPQQKRGTTLNCGRNITGRYRRGLRYIMSMGTPSIMNWRTWFAYQKGTTQESRSLNKSVFRSNVSFAIRNLEVRTQERSGGLSDSAQVNVGKRNTIKKVYTKTQKERALFAVPRQQSSDQIQLSVVPSRVLSNSATGTEKPVYNLETEDGTFYANGILNSNCDALRYALMSWSEPMSELQQKVGAPGTLLHLLDQHRGRQTSQDSYD